jgi:5-methylcytosine-specific restriction endonuclease McrA
MTLQGDKKREYQKEWIAKRRNEYFANKVCAICGANNNLELDHINSEEKETHRIWSWCKEKRDKELKKCQILCEQCHKEKTSKENKNRFTIVPKLKMRKLNNEQINEIRKLKEQKYSDRKIASLYNIGYATVSEIIRKVRY